MPTLLFVCTANRFRSPLAAHYFQNKMDERNSLRNLTISSAGTWTKDGQKATREAELIANEAGLSLEAHRSREVTDTILQEADLILVMEAGHKEAISSEFPAVASRIRLLSNVTIGVGFDIPDPYSTPEPAERIAKEIFKLLDQGYQRIVELAFQMCEKEVGE